MNRVVWLAVLVVVAGSSVWGQSITTDGDIETDGQLVSKVATGTAPLEVSSETTVRNLSADFLDGKHGNAFALISELLAAIESLDNPDPPCFSMTHRFVDCGNGTVTDTVTGLIYLKNPKDCYLVGMDYQEANESAAALEHGQCGLTDGSRAGDWRLKTKEEWIEILDAGCDDPQIVGNGTGPPGCFSDAEWASVDDQWSYWSSTTFANDSSKAAYARLWSPSGNTIDHEKDFAISAWPVRGGQ